MGRSDSKKWEGLTPKNGKVCLRKVERTDPKKWQGLTQKWEVWLGKVGRTDSKK